MEGNKVMLEIGVKANILTTTAIAANSAQELTKKLGIWLESNNTVIHDLQIFQDIDAWAAIVVFRK